VCGCLCQIGAKDDHGFVRRSGGSAWTGRIGNGTEDAAGPVNPDRRAGWLQGAPLGLVCRPGDPLGVELQQHADATSTRQGRARLTVDHHRERHRGSSRGIPSAGFRGTGESEFASAGRDNQARSGGRLRGHRGRRSPGWLTWRASAWQVRRGRTSARSTSDRWPARWLPAPAASPIAMTAEFQESASCLRAIPWPR
jgi:hypothetical protein